MYTEMKPPSQPLRRWRGVASAEAHLKREQNSAAARLPRRHRRRAPPALPPVTGRLSAGGPASGPRGLLQGEGRAARHPGSGPSPQQTRGEGSTPSPPGRGSQPEGSGRILPLLPPPLPARAVVAGARGGIQTAAPGGQPRAEPLYGPSAPARVCTRVPTRPPRTERGEQRAQPYLGWQRELQRKIMGTAKYL